MNNENGSLIIQFPAFSLSEIVLGKIAGKGGFNTVFKISKINLQECFDTDANQAKLRATLANEMSKDDLVLKKISNDLPKEAYEKAAVDLAIEVRFLKKFSYAHIISLRAIANSDPHESRYFLILERLVSTLHDKIQEWTTEVKVSKGIWLGPFGYCFSNKKVLQKNWIKRIIVARNIASTMRYLHHQDIIYRDLKPDNIGFNQKGDVKIFDFGLAKTLHPDMRNTVGLYMMTGRTGSLRYMAPEVALGQPYDLRADSYSFGILFWQICALIYPYSGYSCEMHTDLVIMKGYRPKPDRSWPETWSRIMQQCWSNDIFDRPDFDRIVVSLDDELELLLANKNNCQYSVKTNKKKMANEQDLEQDLQLDTDTRASCRTSRCSSIMKIGSRLHEADIV